MARIVSDWRIDFMRAYPRLFDLMTDEPERSASVFVRSKMKGRV